MAMLIRFCALFLVASAAIAEPIGGSLVQAAGEAPARENDGIHHAAAAGDLDAQVTLGVRYWGSEDYTEAARWIRKAAEAGDPRGQFWLGALYEGGEGVPQNYERARHWYRQAAEQGSPYAQYGLGRLYFDVDGAPRNLVQAHKWFNIGATAGHPLAIRARERLNEMMTSDQIAEAQRLAREWIDQNSD